MVAVGNYNVASTTFPPKKKAKIQSVIAEPKKVKRTMFQKLRSGILSIFKKSA